MADKKPNKKKINLKGARKFLIAVVLAIAIIFGLKECVGKTTQDDQAQLVPVVPSARAMQPTETAPALQAQTTCPPFSREGAVCEVKSSCSGWIRPAPGSATGLVYAWEPNTDTSEALQSTFRKIRYLDAIGAPHDWEPGTRAEGALAWEFCPKQTVTISYSLVEAGA